MTVTAEAAKRILPLAIQRELNRIGWNQAELARRTGLTPMTVSNIVAGKHEPKVSILKSIAEALGVSADQLLSEPRAARSKQPA